MARRLRVAAAQLGAVHLFPLDQLCPAEVYRLVTAQTGIVPPALD